MAQKYAGLEPHCFISHPSILIEMSDMDFIDK